jgi:hypothetical protein
METLLPPRPLQEIFREMAAAIPHPIANFVPSNAAAQKEAFLKGEIDNPAHTYTKLKTYDFQTNRDKIQELSAQISAHPEVNPKHHEMYEEFTAVSLKTLRLMEIAAVLPEAAAEEKSQLEQEFMQLNIELYGAPSEETYHALIHEEKEKIIGKKLKGEALKLQESYFALLPETDASEKRFKPKPETVAWVQTAAKTLYGNLLRHIPEPTEIDSTYPDDEIFGPHDIKAIFDEIIREEFGEAAEGWSVVVEEAKSITVEVIAAEKTIRIPVDRKPVSRNQLTGLIVHELGVHFLRAVSGYDTDNLLMAIGMPNYYASEEGLATVMQQAIKGAYVDSGIPYYLVVSMMYFEGKTFQEAHEVMWRRSLLNQLQDGDSAVTEEAIDTAGKNAYSPVFRIRRVTLPWFKDLAYYNGNEKMWKFLEENIGDDMMLALLLSGKGDLTQGTHKTAVLETRSK